jgi:agmatinase
VIAVYGHCGQGKISQLVYPAGDRSELPGRRVIRMHMFGLTAWTRVFCASRKMVYFSLDLDILDPAVFPGTGTPSAAASAFRNCWAQ